MIVLKVYSFDDMSSAIPIVLEDDKCYCDHNLNGFDTLTFEIQRKNDNHKSIVEEAKVYVFGNRFIIKKIDEHSDFTTVNCELDLDEWKAKINKNYRAVNELITNVIQNVIPDGWTITYGTGVDTTSRATVEKQEGKEFIAVTSLELLDYISNAFSVVFNFDVLLKTITVINIDAFTSSGDFFMEDLNMTELGYNGDSTNFITRVYAYGKDGLTFADINDDKEYVENVSYSNKIINYVLIDERYTVKANLLQYAQKVLNEKCQPVKSYTCSIKNFEGSIWLYKVVTIIDQRRQTKVEHQCVKYREYNNHSLDVITLSSQSPSIEKIVSDNVKTTNDLIAEQSTYIFGVIQDEIEEATSKITGNQGGYFKWIYDADGKPIELVNIGDTKDINTAQKVWRWNQGGLGHSNNGYNGTYDLALTNDGKINASMITTGILNAGVIRAGIIQDLQNSNFWNLETGAFSLSANATVGGSTVSSIAQTEAEAAVNAQTQLSIFNKLTNNGATQGIYLYNNLLYLNGAYLKANSVSADVIYGGSLTLGGANNVNGRLYVKDASGISIIIGDNSGLKVTKGLIEGPDIRSKGQYHVGGISYQKWAMLKDGEFRIMDSVYDATGPQTVKANFGLRDDLWAVIECLMTSNYGAGVAFSVPGFDQADGNGGIYGMKFYKAVTKNIPVMHLNGALFLRAAGNHRGIFWDQRSLLTSGKTNFDDDNESYGILPHIIAGSVYGTNVVGGLYVNGNSVSSSSSVRYKENISEKMDNENDPHRLLLLKAKQGRYKKEYGYKLQYADMAGKTVPMFIAEDVAKIYPSAVIHSEDGNVESWDERRIIPGMLALIQEHENKINYILDNYMRCV